MLMHAMCREFRYFTFLRNPREHFFSYYSFIKKVYRSIEHPLTLSILPPDADTISSRDCAEWTLWHSRDIPFRDSEQTDYFASIVWRSEWAPGTDLLALVPNWRQDHWHAYRRERVSVAKAVLDDFLLVGIVEEMETSSRLLVHRLADFGFMLSPAGIPHSNISRDSLDDVTWATPADSVGKRLLESLEADFELYRHGLDRLKSER